MGGRIRRLLGGVALVGLALGPAASPTFACISESPTFAQVVARADTIARVTIVDGTDYDAQRDIEVFRVERILKGKPGPLIELLNPKSGLCGDPIGAMTTDHGGGGVGETIILATGVEYYGEVIHPFWHQGLGGLGGMAARPAAADTMAKLEGAILTALAAPDTSTSPTGETASVSGLALPTLIVIAAAIVVSALMIRRRFSADG